MSRIWWKISVACSMVACSILIVNAYKKWEENPVIVTFSEKMSFIKEIPFPAVSICPEIKSRRIIFNYTETLLKIRLDESPPYYGLQESEFKLAAAQFQVCESTIIQNHEYIGENFTDDSIFELIRELAPGMHDSLEQCAFKTAHEYCEDFQEVITGDGLCFTFNALMYKQMFVDGFNTKIMTDKNIPENLYVWTQEDGYDIRYNENSTSKAYLYPYRVLSAGSKGGLKVVISLIEDDMDYICSGPIQGFKVILHSPDELPQVTGQYFRVPVGQDMRMSIKPNMLRTAESLRGYSPERRQCYFSSERKLQYMRAYTQRNCELECLANFTLERCGCVRFSMPHDSRTPICGMKKVPCYNDAENHFLEDSFSSDISKISSCNCLPACVSISYETETSQATYEWKKFFTAFPGDNLTLEELKGIELSSISIFFKENQFIASKRSELVGLTDFISSCGGLLGLFMGVSILSIVELIYYFSLRVCCSIRSNKIQEQSKKWPKKKVRLNPNRPYRPWYIDVNTPIFKSHLNN